MPATNLFFYLLFEEMQKKINRVKSAGLKPKMIIINNSHAETLNRIFLRSRGKVNIAEFFNLPVVIDNKAKEIIIGVGND
ncbi:MAG: hypothetical protein E7Z88_05165 [Cyanobacteria bacterium SIG27]|nr:hypothetical protein [Cyanobacteria bacterium SIG27]